MAYTAPNDLFTSEEAILSLASSIADEDRTNLGNGTINGALDVLADALAERNVEVPPMNAGAILALAEYVSGGGGGGGDLTTANVTLVNTKTGSVYLTIPCEDEESETSSCEAYAEGEASVTVRAILYKGTCRAVNNGNSITVSGNAVYTPTPFDPKSGPITITGDCTITFSD